MLMTVFFLSSLFIVNNYTAATFSAVTSNFVVPIPPSTKKKSVSFLVIRGRGTLPLLIGEGGGCGGGRGKPLLQCLSASRSHTQGNFKS